MAAKNRVYGTSNNGRLILPYATVIWGGVNLSYYGDRKEPVWKSLSLDLEYQSTSPRLQLEFRNDILGYNAFVEVSKSIRESNDKAEAAKENLKKALSGSSSTTVTNSASPDEIKSILDDLANEKITVEFGYENGTKTQKYEFYYTGMKLESGNSQSLSIEAQTITEADINSVRASMVVNRDEEKTLKEIVEMAQKKFDAGDVEIEYPEDWSKRKVKQVMLAGSTFSSFLSKFASDQACMIQILAKGKKIVIRENPVKEVKRRGVQESPSGDSIGPTCFGFLLGPGLMETIARTTTFRTTPSTPLVPDSPPIQESLSLQEEDDKKDAVPRKNTPIPKREDVAESKRDSIKDKYKTGSAIKPNTPRVTKDEAETKIGEDKAQSESVSECKASGEFFMVPQIVGIKPGDVFFIPSLKGDYVEDWFITKVGYSAAKGGVRVSVDAVRFAIDEKVVSEEDINRFTKKAAGFNSPEAWNKYYWRV